MNGRQMISDGATYCEWVQLDVGYNTFVLEAQQALLYIPLSYLKIFSCKRFESVKLYSYMKTP